MTFAAASKMWRRTWDALRAAIEAGTRQQITRTGLFFSLACALVGLAAFASANNLLFLILAAMLGTLLISGLVSRLTLAGLEVGGVRVVGQPVPEGLHAKNVEAGPPWDRDKVKTAHVLGVEKHPNADRLTLVTLDYGAGQPKTVVTGAPNLKVGDRGQKVILGLAGGVRVVRKTEDITSTLTAVAVGALVTFGPLALLQAS